MGRMNRRIHFLRAAFHCLFAATLGVTGCGGADAEESAPGPDEKAYPALPVPLASFGAALLDNAVYTYGGHIGEPHAHSRHNISPTFFRLDLAAPDAWASLGPVIGLQSPALVAHGGMLYRVGGFNALNAAGEAEDLRSTASVDRFDPATGEWTALPDMPEARSSHEAVVVGDMLYVLAGWGLQGDSSSGTFHSSGFRMNLSAPDAGWEPLATESPFKRRAVAAAAAGGKVYVIGGMTDAEAMSGAVDVLDTATGTWSAGPSLPVSPPLEGFGASACAAGDTVYTSGYDGVVRRLSEAGDGWEDVAKLRKPRFFHRLICASDGEVLVIGGEASGEHTTDIEVVRVRQARRE